mmetsp:Transcript_111608/g.214970  ORF Transcript_111608/g.214970 Transcript_111608/m.214970 type:complete len:260 (-) Transcript_111608:130-909(-)
MHHSWNQNFLSASLWPSVQESSPDGTPTCLWKHPHLWLTCPLSSAASCPTRRQHPARTSLSKPHLRQLQLHYLLPSYWLLRVLDQQQLTGLWPPLHLALMQCFCPVWHSHLLSRHLLHPYGSMDLRLPPMGQRHPAPHTMGLDLAPEAVAEAEVAAAEVAVVIFSHLHPLIQLCPFLQLHCDRPFLPKHSNLPDWLAFLCKLANRPNHPWGAGYSNHPCPQRSLHQMPPTQTNLPCHRADHLMGLQICFQNACPLLRHP